MKRIITPVAVCYLVLSTATPAGYAISDTELVRIREGFEMRRDQYLRGYLNEPLYEIDEGISACTAALPQAKWIWHPDENGLRRAPVGARYFQRELVLPSDATVKRAYCAVAADNFCELSLNGDPVGRVSGFKNAQILDITRKLDKGRNVLSAVVHNAGKEANPAGLIGIVAVQFDRGRPLVVSTDEHWRARSGPNADWLAAEVLGPCGCPPWGAVSCQTSTFVTRYVFSRLTFALAALSLQTELDRANAAILEAVRKIRGVNQSVGEFGLHWMGGVFYRIHGLFGTSGTSKNLLSEAASEAIWRLFADWARSQSRIADTDPEKTWHIWGSENHSAQRDAAAWAAARMISADPRGRKCRYDDGSTAAEQLSAWRAFLKRYFRERIRRGMLIEISPSGYGSRTLQGWHNIYDFADDPELKSLARAALDVWWAEWAQEQLEGMRGGGKTRLYPGVWALSHSDRNRAMSWFYLGEGWPAHHHETLPVIATTEYRLPLVIMDIALDSAGRGVYECKSRRLGRHLSYELSQSLSTPETPVNVIDPEYGGIVRYSYCTPDFIIGTLMLESRPTTYWTNISQQNRWHGIVFAGRRDSVLYPRCLGDRNTYNEQWSIQNKGTLIVQKLRTSLAKDMRVCFSKDLEPHEDDGWFFARAARAFAAVKVVEGGWRWDDARWLRLDNEYSPVIIEVARSQDYNHELSAFKWAVSRQAINFADKVLRYQGLSDSGSFTFYAAGNRTPELNGRPIDFAPDYAFDSPFLREGWASGIVHIQKGDREYTVDVREKGQ
ncbi:MAG: hypothetical protein ACYTBS_08600 [Planctomycetota bacterium]